MSKRGTADEFNALHARTCRILNKMLEAAEAGMLAVGKNDEGEPLVGMPPPALLAQAIKFLKENGIDRPDSGVRKQDTLAEEMPDLDEIERGNVVAFKR